MPDIIADIPVSLKSAWANEVQRLKSNSSAVVTAALAQYLGMPVHTIFQVSTSGALVAGVYSGMVSVEAILTHGDFGVGTFADLDGEMVVLDGVVYQVRGTGQVSVAPATARRTFCGPDTLLPGTGCRDRPS
jgi:acetolactate decarboxylase